MALPPSPAQVWASGDYPAVAERIGGLSAALLATVERRLGGVAGRDLLDLACGTGSLAFAAARAGARVTGLDVTPELLAVARTGAEAAGLDVAWVLADATSTGLPDRSQDAVASSVGAIFVPDSAALLAETVRVLRPGGVLGLTAWVPQPTDPVRDRLGAFLPPPPPGAEVPWDWGRPDVVAERLAEGFDDLQVEERAQPWRFGSVEEAAAFFVERVPVYAALAERLPADRRAAMLEAGREGFAEHTANGDGGGEVRMEMPYLVITARSRDPRPLRG